ncbi:Transient receptor potential cation channel subfamily M member 3 [Holothuria leucospilota]|uniref:Transient receptor potential cation channel subfamily M member 3 n=1 Tax=Holothuria leucospilota TaxID=206669 RepID=A0A9Q1BLR0_HOLLE|nr:Transient receptor potential cation channel subfamily M member 3 [Holothuria leucospilota]
MAQSWIEETFQKKECKTFIGETRDPMRCRCGRTKADHGFFQGELPPGRQAWNPRHHTLSLPTDAYGQIEFRGAGHGNKAMYIRIADHTDPADILKLMKKHWKLGLPNLVISILGGLRNFEIQPKLKRVLCKGLSKAARTTGAWILTRGTNTGVGIHVGDALNNHSVKMRGRITTIGMCSWGVLNKRENFLGKDLIKSYHSVACPIAKGFKLNSHHTHFLFVDDGTVGQSGAEILLRQKFEKHISQQRLNTQERVPVVSVIIEGGPTAIRTVLANISAHPRIPVVVFDGTGRAADILAFAQKYSNEEGCLTDSLRVQLLETIKHTFSFNQHQAENLYKDLMLCMKKKQLITVFCLGEDGLEDFDLAILSALLKAQSRANPGNKLRLALAWDRADIAKQQIFVHGKDLSEGTLEQAMFEALANNQVDFVKLLKDNGVNFQKFLTVARLEDLYNTTSGPPNTLGYLVSDVRKSGRQEQRYNLYDIGMVVENLMGGTYSSSYTSRKFKVQYSSLKKELSFSFKRNVDIQGLSSTVTSETFLYPFNELFMWAVLTKRHQMALFLWKQDEEALAKALIASQLYKAMAKAADLINLENEIGEEFIKYSVEFKTLALKLLDQCYKEDDDVTLQLLTVKLDNWSDQTCLSLAAAAEHLDFMAHPCCQVLLSDLWMGGLQIRKYINLKVILALVIPPAILLLSFKSKEELLLMPQTFSEHIQDVVEAKKDNDNDEACSSSSSSTSSFTRLKEDDESFRQSNPVSGVSLQERSMLGSPSVTVQTKRKRQLSLLKKLHEFYSAPITKFWALSIAYILFLGLYTFVVLGRVQSWPAIPEMLLISYVVTLGMDHVRELFQSEPPKLSQKLRVFSNSYGNIILSLSVVIFLIGVGLRFYPPTRGWGRVIYSLDIVLWYLQLFIILSVNMYLGTLVNMIGKMMRDMCYFVVLLVIILMSFGVIRESVLNPDRDVSWLAVREVFHEPYWMIYGEVYAGEIIYTCEENATDTDASCPSGAWVVPVAMAIYLIVANILLVNLLIAVFNNTFNKVSSISKQLWKYQRYYLTMKYEQKSILVPPFILLKHCYCLIKSACCRCITNKDESDRGLKLFLPSEEVEMLRDFEEACLELYFKETASNLRASNEEQIRVMAAEMENNSYRLQEIVEKENHTRMNLISFDRRLMKLEMVMYQMVGTLQGIHEIMLKTLSADGSRESLAEAEVGQHAREVDLNSSQDQERGISNQSTPNNQNLIKLRSHLHLSGLQRIPGVEVYDTNENTPEDFGVSPISDVLYPTPSPIVGTDSSSPAQTVDSPSNSPCHSEKVETKGNGKAKQGRKSKKGNVLTRLSTFERYVSLVAPEEEAQEEDEVIVPVKRQVGIFRGQPVQEVVYPSKLRIRLNAKSSGPSHANSEGNVSCLSDSSMRDYSSMPRPTPYVSAPAYTTITDYIDKSELLRQPQLQLLKGRPGETSMDMSNSLYPHSPTPTAESSFFPRLKPSLRSHARLENESLEMEEMVCYNRMNDVGNQSPGGLDDAVGEDRGITFEVKSGPSLV